MAVQADDVPDDEAPAPMTGSGARGTKSCSRAFEYVRLGWDSSNQKGFKSRMGAGPKVGTYTNMRTCWDEDTIRHVQDTGKAP